MAESDVTETQSKHQVSMQSRGGRSVNIAVVQHKAKHTQKQKPPRTGSMVHFNESQMFSVYVNSDRLYEVWADIKYYGFELRQKTSAYYDSTLVQLCVENDANSSEAVCHLRNVFRAVWRDCQEVTKRIETCNIEAQLKELTSQEKCKQQSVQTFQRSLTTIHQQVRNCKLHIEQSFQCLKGLALEEQDKKSKKLHCTALTSSTVGSLSAAIVAGAAMRLAVQLEWEWTAVGSIVVLGVSMIVWQLFTKKKEDQEGESPDDELLKLCQSHIRNFKESIVMIYNLLHEMISILS